MAITCKCLNICIEVNNDILSFQNHGELSANERGDEFFKNLELGFIYCGKVSSEQSFLVHSHETDSWLVNCCLYCLTYTHAMSKMKGEERIIVNKSLTPVSISDLTMLKRSKDYSEIFGIILLDVSGDTEKIMYMHNDIKDDYETAMVQLNGILNNKIEEEHRKTNERIRIYTENEIDTLNKYKEHAHDHYETLARVLNTNKKKLQDNKANKIPYGEKFENKFNGNGRLESDKLQVSDSHPNLVKKARINANGYDIDIRQQTLSQSPENESEFNIPASLDTEGLFSLDGMEETTLVGEEEHSEDDLTDTDDSGSRDEGIHIPRRKSNVMIARSLPIRVPMNHDSSFQWMDETKTKRNYKYEKNERHPTDIAASIKALANSVHGEALFGDLPPPRIGSRI